MAHAFVLRSPVAHAHIKRIDTATARHMPGVLFMPTGEDLRSDGRGWSRTCGGGVLSAIHQNNYESPLRGLELTSNKSPVV
jgi:CO/xanthine dehydrogenase Mo-binding subunit